LSAYLSKGAMWPKNEADHSPPSSTEFYEVWSSTSIPQYLNDMMLN